MRTAVPLPAEPKDSCSGLARPSATNSATLRQDAAAGTTSASGARTSSETGVKSRCVS